MNFTDKQLTGVVDFKAKGITAPVVGTGYYYAGSYVITAHSGIGTDAEGQTITGPGIPANTTIVSVSIANDEIIFQIRLLLLVRGCISLNPVEQLYKQLIQTDLILQPVL